MDSELYFKEEKLIKIEKHEDTTTLNEEIDILSTDEYLTTFKEEPCNDNIKEEQEEVITIIIEEAPITLLTPLNNNNSQCIKCDLTFTNVREHALHYRYQHNKNLKIRNNSKSELFKCETCKERFKYKYLLNIHLKLHNENNQTNFSVMYNCNPCGLTFNTYPKVRLHFLQFHAGTKKCIQCNLQFRTHNLCKWHFKTHRIKHYLCLPCKLRFRSNEKLLKHYLSESHKKQLICEVCNKVFNRPNVRRLHMEVHHCNKKQHQCHVCGKEFNLRSTLNRHVQEHNVDLSFFCEYCKEGFKRKDQLYSHKRYHHNSNKPLLDVCRINAVCYICGKIIKTEDIEAHIKNHPDHITLEMTPGTCSECSEEFQSQLKLFKHTFLKHQGFLCVKCGLKMTHLTRLAFHMTTHKDFAVENATQNECGDYVCNICNKTIKFKTSLRYHMFMHSGEKPHVCEVCGKRFRKPYDLKIHSYIHTKDYPFKCNVCEAVFSQKCGLKTHMDKNAHRGRQNSQKNSVICKHCDAVFATASACKKHMKFINSLDTVLVVDDEEDIKSSQDKSGQICEAVFPQKSELKTHVDKKAHKGRQDSKKSVICEHCDAVFATASACKKHMKFINSLDTVLVVDDEEDIKSSQDKSGQICEAVIPQKSELKTHVDKKAHKGRKDSKKSVICEHCDAVFATASACKKHMKFINSLDIVDVDEKDIRSIHVIRNTFDCMYCDQVFTARKVYLKHVNDEHVFPTTVQGAL